MSLNAIETILGITKMVGQDESDVDEEKFATLWRAAGRLRRLFGRELEELKRREMASGDAWRGGTRGQ